MKRSIAVLGVVTLLGVVAFSVASADARLGSRAARAIRVDKFVHYHVSDEAQASAAQYWTPARMASATPRGLLKQSGAAPKDFRGGAFIRSAARHPTMIAGSGAAPDSPAGTTDAIPTRSSGGYSYPFPFSRFEMPGLTGYTASPMSTIGKIFATDASGDYVCSGAAIVSTNKSVVWTAGHCVRYKFGPFTNMIFVPGYRDGVEPFGRYTVVDSWVPHKWVKSNFKDSRADYAAVTVDNGTLATPLTDEVGSLGIAWGLPRIQHWMDFGYPAVSPFSGSRQIVCAASFAANDPAFRRKPPVGIGCDMSAGSSGGPWITLFGTKYYLNGVNSHRYTTLPKAIFSPYFGDGVRRLYGCATDGIC